MLMAYIRSLSNTIHFTFTAPEPHTHIRMHTHTHTHARTLKHTPLLLRWTLPTVFSDGVTSTENYCPIIV